MPTSESSRLSTSVATANIATPTTATTSAAMENAWAAPLPRTYFVAGYRVEHVRDTLGHSTWTCDCAEFARAQQSASEEGCEHTRRIAAAAELDRLLRTPGLIMPTSCY
ncbi:MAG: hypothetical protein WDO56_32250 [Gammaproteobacteria bacterium]